MLIFRGLVVAVALGIWIASVVDVVRSDAAAVHHLHKVVWLVFVLLIPLFGVPCWLLLGRSQPLFTRWFETPRSAPRPPPDDSPEFLAKLEDEIRRRRRAEQLRARPEDTKDIDEEIRRLEDELRRRSEEDSGDDPNQ